MLKKFRTTDAAQRHGGVEARVQKSKLTAVSLSSSSVVRTEITDLIARSGSARLILFRAPAGFGKTTAMLQYRDSLQRVGITTAWLTLDPLDDDFRRLLIHLIAAFDQVLSPQDSFDRPGTAPPATSNFDQLALDLIDRIADCKHRYTLFIDEFEAVSDRSIDDLLRLILSRMPSGAQLAIASRKTPELQLDRLRAQDQLVEVDQVQLRFSCQESATFLGTFDGLTLTAKTVTRLHSATEGWPAALWLAATAMENREQPDFFIARFSGTNASVVDYLAEEVLFRQPDEMQDFLIKTSILNELNPELCDAVCKRHDSAAVLRTLEHSNVCVTQVDNEQRLYRYHRLFADFLRNQVNRLYPDELPGLHLITAQWYEAAGRWIPAIEHALASGQVAYTLLLLETHTNSLLFQGRYHLLARWLDTLPGESLRAKPQLRIAHIWALTFTGRSTQGLRMLKAFESDNSGIALTQDVLDELKFMHPFILMILDQHADGLLSAGELLLKKSAPESFSYCMMIAALANWRIAANKFAEAARLMNYIPQDRAGRSRNIITDYPLRLEGCTKLVQCQVGQAIAEFRAVLDGAAARSGRRSVALYLAESLYEIDQLQEAEQLLALYLPLALEYATPDTLIISHILQARIAFDRGDIDHAFWRLSELEYFGQQRKLPRLIAAAQLEWAHIALLRNDVAQAQVHYERAANPAAWNSLQGLIMPANDVESLALCHYRLAVHGIDRKACLPLLRADISAAQAGSRHRRALKLSILLSKLLYQSGQHRLALSILHDALVIAAREGMVRTFLDEGMPILDLLREYRVARSASSDRELDVFIDRILVRGDSSWVSPTPDDSFVDASATLTARELQILKSLALGLPNISIAQDLFVSKTTVRTHLYRIYAKLGTSNRIQAVSMGRRLGLIK
jgi:LuxR family maltose regulon positive regulatory protein